MIRIRSDRPNFFKKTACSLPLIKNISTVNFENLTNDLDIIISPFFTGQELDQLARETGFVKRKGKIDGSLFIDLIVFNSESLKSQSLNDLSVVLNDEHGINIAKQSLHERFNAYAVTFLRTALEKLMGKQLDVTPYLLNIKGVKRILIKDSVCFQVDPSLHEHYPGSGGCGSKANVRIQFEYDILCGKINDLSLNAFNDQDATNSVATLELLEKGDLIIRDLAYVGLDALQGIILKAAHYLCRLGTNVKVYELKGDEYVVLNFDAVRKHMKATGVTLIEKKVYIGADVKLETRLVIHLMPEDEVNKRIRKAKQNRITRKKVENHQQKNT